MNRRRRRDAQHLTDAMDQEILQNTIDNRLQDLVDLANRLDAHAVGQDDSDSVGDRT